MAGTGDVLCDYNSSLSSADENKDLLQIEPIIPKTSLNSKSKENNERNSRESSSGSSSSTKRSSVLPSSYSLNKSNSHDKSSSKRKRRHRSRSNHKKEKSWRSKKRHSRSSSRRRRPSHSPSRRKSSHKHSKKRHSDSHRERHDRHSRRKRHKRRRYSSSSSSSDSSDDHRSSKAHQSKTNNRSDERKKSNHVSSVSVNSISKTTVTVPVVAPVPRIDPQDIINKIQLHQEAQAKAQAAVAAAASNLPKFYNPASVNAVKLAEQQKKRKLLWSKKTDEIAKDEKTSAWSGTAIIASKGDSAAAAKFRKLMGIHETDSAEDDPTEANTNSTVVRQAEAQAELFRRLESEYEMSRALTHTQRGVGLGFGTATHVDYSSYSAMHDDKSKEN